MTYFLHVEPSDSILEVKEKLQALSEQPVDQQRLTLVSTGQVLEDGKTLAEQKVSPSRSMHRTPCYPFIDSKDPLNNINCISPSGSGCVRPALFLTPTVVVSVEYLTIDYMELELQVENDAVVALQYRLPGKPAARVQTYFRSTGHLYDLND